MFSNQYLSAVAPRRLRQPDAAGALPAAPAAASGREPTRTRQRRAHRRQATAPPRKPQTDTEVLADVGHRRPIHRHHGHVRCRPRAQSERAEGLCRQARRHALGHRQHVPARSLVLAGDLVRQSADRKSTPHLSRATPCTWRSASDGRTALQLVAHGAICPCEQARAAAAQLSRSTAPIADHSVCGHRGVPERPGVLSRDEIDKAPYVLALRGEHDIAGTGDEVYVKKLTHRRSARATSVMHVDEELKNPDGGRKLGYLAIYTGTAQLMRPGQIAKATLTDSASRDAAGRPAGLRRPHRRPRISSRMRRPGRYTAESSRWSTSADVAGQYDVVAINRGSSDGLERGNVLTAEEAQAQSDDQCAHINDFSTCMRAPERDAAERNRRHAAGVQDLSAHELRAGAARHRTDDVERARPQPLIFSASPDAFSVDRAHECGAGRRRAAAPMLRAYGRRSSSQLVLGRAGLSARRLRQRHRAARELPPGTRRGGSTAATVPLRHCAELGLSPAAAAWLSRTGSARSSSAIVAGWSVSGSR